MSVDAPTRATGYTSEDVAGISGWWASLAQHEHVPELMWPLSIDVYDRMRNDPQITAMLRATSAPIVRTAWRLDGTGVRPEVTRLVADDFGLPVVGEAPRPAPRTRDRWSWTAHLPEALTCLPFGHSYFEQEARIGTDGLAHLRRLGFRPQRSITDVKVARDGGLVSIQQSYTDAPIPVSRLVAYVHDREGGNWLGRSILRPVYRDWLLIDRLLRVDTMKIERNGVGIPVYTDSGGGDAAAERAAGEALAASIRAGDNAGLAVPHDAKMELLSVMGTLPDSMERLRYHNEQIARAVLGNWMNLGQSAGSGSYALGVSFIEVFNQSLQTIALDICATANAHIVEDLVDWNFGESEPAPRLVFDEIGSQQRLTALGIKALMDAGLILPDRSLEEWVRQTSGMPPKDPLGSFTAPSQGGTP